MLIITRVSDWFASAPEPCLIHDGNNSKSPGTMANFANSNMLSTGTSGLMKLSTGFGFSRNSLLLLSSACIHCLPNCVLYAARTR